MEQLSSPSTASLGDGRPVVVGPLLPHHLDDLRVMFADAVARGDGYPHAAPLTRTAFDETWVRPVTVVVGAVADGRLLGAYYLKPNQPGAGAHVANAGYLVDRLARGRGIGRLLVADSVERAPLAGFDAVQFNFVFESNPARPMYEELGWRQIGRVPDGVADPVTGRRQDALIYWRAVGPAAGRAPAAAATPVAATPVAATPAPDAEPSTAEAPIAEASTPEPPAAAETAAAETAAAETAAAETAAAETPTAENAAAGVVLAGGGAPAAYDEGEADSFESRPLNELDGYEDLDGYDDDRDAGPPTDGRPAANGTAAAATPGPDGAAAPGEGRGSGLAWLAGVIDPARLRRDVEEILRAEDDDELRRSIDRILRSYVPGG